MTNEKRHVNAFDQSDAYKFGWTLGFYDCQCEDGSTNAARHAYKYAQCSLVRFLDVLEGYRDGCECRRDPPMGCPDGR